MAASTTTIIKDDLVQQYCSITGATKDVAKNMLIAMNGNLEMAVNMFLEGSINDQPPFNPTTSSTANQSNFYENSSTNSNNRHLPDNPPLSDSDDVRAPIPQKQAVLVEDNAIPYRKQRNPKTSSVFDSARDFRKETEEQAARLQSGIKHSSKLKRLHDLFQPPVDLLFHGNFQAARNFASKKNKWLLINIQNSTEFACQMMNRDVWSNSLVRDVVKENFVLWQVDHESDEGAHYLMFYKVANYPHLSVVDPRTGESLCVWENLGMKPSAEQFAELASLFLSDHHNDSFINPHTTPQKFIPNKKPSQPASIIDADEDAQLQTALKASLQQTSTATLEDSDCEEDIPKKKQRSHAGESTKSTVSCISTNATVNNQNNSQTSKEEEIISENEKVTIACRLPSSERLTIVLSQNSSLKDLIDKVATNGWCGTKYDIMRAFPRQNFSELAADRTLHDLGLHRQETVFVQEK